MAEKRTPDSAGKDGEGNRTAARQYNDAQHRPAKSGRVPAKARAAEQSLEREKRTLKRAEPVGRSHAKAADPEVKRED